MLTEKPEIQADTPGPPNMTFRQVAAAMGRLGMTTLHAATNDPVTIVTRMAAVEAAILVASRSITKGRPGLTHAGVVTHTTTTTARPLVARTDTKTVIGRPRDLPTSGSAAEILCPHGRPGAGRMTAAGEASLTTTMRAIRTSESGTAAGPRREADAGEADEIAVASAWIRD